MYWPGQFNTWQEAHNSFGVTGTATRWALAEGRMGFSEGFETYVLIANPGDKVAVVRVTFMKPDGSTLIQIHAVRVPRAGTTCS